MNKENCALKLVDEIIQDYDARSKKHQTFQYFSIFSFQTAFKSKSVPLEFLSVMLINFQVFSLSTGK